MSKIEVNQIEKTSTGSEIQILSNVTFASGMDITLPSTHSLTDGITATTQTSNDNSTKVATTAYVDNAVGGIDLSGYADIGLVIALG